MKTYYFLFITCLIHVRIHAQQVDSILCKRTMDFVINDVKNKIPKKSKLFFSKKVLPTISYPYIPSYGYSFVVDTIGFEKAYKKIDDTTITMTYFEYENKKIRFKRKKKDYEILLHAPLKFNLTTNYISIVISNGKESFVYILFVDDKNIDCIISSVLF